MASEDERLAFRLRHIIPRSLTPATYSKSGLMTVLRKPSSPNEPEEVEIQMTWGKIYAKIWGPENGRPVFAICGWLDNVGSYDTLIPLLSKDMRIVVFDTPGHGLSDPYPPDIAYNLTDGLLALERFAEKFNWKKFSIISHSMGGCLAMLYSGIFPDRLEKLVLLDILRLTPTIPDTVDVRLKKTVSKLLKYENDIIAGSEKPMGYEEAVEKAVSGTFGSLDEQACDILFKRGLKKVDGGFVYSRDRRLLAAPLSFIPKEDMLFLATKVTADVLIIKYSDGPYFESEEDYKEHVEAIKSSKAKIVKYIEVNGAHHTHLTHPERVSSLINEFFNS